MTGGSVERVARNASLLAGATVAARLSGLALGIVLARALGPTVYGRFALAIAVAAIFLPVADAGMQIFLARESARRPEDGVALTWRLMRVKLAVSLIVYVLAAVGIVLLVGDRETRLALLVVLAAAVFDGLSQLVFALFQGRQRMGLESGLSSAAAIARAAGGSVLALTVERLWPVLAWIVAVSIVQAVTAVSRVAKEEWTTRPVALAIPWRKVVALGAFTLFVMAYIRIDTILIGWLKDERAVGLYAAAYTVLLGIQIVPAALGTALFPVFARAIALEREGLDRPWHHGIRTTLLLVLPLSLVISMLAAPLLSLMFGPEFTGASTALAILAWSAPLAALNVLVSGVVRNVGWEERLTRTAAIAVLANVALNLWAIPAFGIGGAAAVTIVTELLLLVWLGGSAVRQRIVPLPRLPLWQVVAALAVAAGASAAFDGLGVAIALPVSLAVYVAVLVASGAVTADDRALLRSVLAGGRQPAQ